MDKIAVLIPCYNEELTIGKVVKNNCQGNQRHKSSPAGGSYLCI